MNKNIEKNEIVKIQNDAFNQLYRQMAINCAPTILGEKPASLFCIKNKPTLIKNFEDQQPRIEKLFGVKIFVLKHSENHLVILLYNLIELMSILSTTEASQFLESMGYVLSDSLDVILYQLSTNFEAGCPHEIGIFLGYPILDVKAFLEPKSECLLCGYWKVFSNVESAKKTFERYDKAKAFVTNVFENGLDFQELLLCI
ncbi:DUF3793 family protein [Fusibacter sp. Q10-2]|uniref:DUF3793 family protein n=2 Tax=Fusibacter ferrireducens TaxID=2785058 RepID=A0ABR9ZVM4_9FIRM|nr:DUF3793 family protein [Fusibacter ferrireducens]